MPLELGPLVGGGGGPGRLFTVPPADSWTFDDVRTGGGGGLPPRFGLDPLLLGRGGGLDEGGGGTLKNNQQSMNIGKVLCDSVLFCLELYHLNQKEERNRQSSVMQMSSVVSIHPTSESIVIYSIKQILLT